MRPEHTKPFNAEHAKAGAPYCQRNGLAALIGIWNGRNPIVPLIGERENSKGQFSATTWTANGGNPNPNGTESNDLVMLPLGYCEGKPVFVGDELVNSVGVLNTVSARERYFEPSLWPRTAPVMPKSSYVNEGEWTTYDKIFAHHLKTQRKEIEAYWKALDEFNGEKK